MCMSVNLLKCTASTASILNNIILRQKQISRNFFNASILYGQNTSAKDCWEPL